MCALFGWLDYKHIVPYKVLKKLTQALAMLRKSVELMQAEFHISVTARL